MSKKIIAITMGDPSGIGPEIVLKAITSGKIDGDVLPLIIGDISVFERMKELLKSDISVRVVNGFDGWKRVREEVYRTAGSGNILFYNSRYITDSMDIKIGEVSELSGRASYGYIKVATELAEMGIVDAVVTSPINKESIKLAGVEEAGHTEILATLTASKSTVTMFSVDRLKIFFHTRHVSLKKAIELLTIDGIFNTIDVSSRALKSIGIENPILALAALNPHASDGGLFGDEERVILIPACAKATKAGITVHGPIPADSVFHQCLEGKYDAVVSLYHDQGHIAAKTYDFYRTVSVTLGLPFIRTSVDHGTGFDIAWKGIANPVSMIEAVNMACKLSLKYRPEFIK